MGVSPGSSRSRGHHSSASQPAPGRTGERRRLETQTSRAADRLMLACLVALGAVLGCDRGPGPAADPPDSGLSTDATPTPVRDTVLEAALRQAAAEIQGHIGVAVLHLQSGVHASVNGDRRFLLASIYKLPIAYAAVQGDFDPADSVLVTPADRAPGETPFAPGMAVPLAGLVERSLAHSDNTASDVLLRSAGGPDEVKRRIQALGVHDVRVDRSMARVFAGWRGVPDPEDVRDTGSGAGVVTLLAALHRGDELRPEARRLLIEALQAAATGPDRIRAGVPAGTAVAHKTGTLGPLAERERVIAALARAVWDRFTDARSGR
jgi:beta-lactamase class A